MRVHPRTLRDGRADLFANWIVEAYQKNLPFDKFATEIMTAAGDTFTNPTANYFLGAPTTEDLTETTTQIFMGSRINCAKCHNHPFARAGPEEDYYRITAVFDRIKKEGDTVTVALTGETKNPTTGKVVRPWGAEEKVNATDRRVAFAHWLTKPGNPYFARVEVNRIWAQLLGRGIVHPVDDFRSSNPPANVELLDALARDFEKSGFDRKHMIRLICNSRTYQRSSATSKFNEDDQQLFSHALVRRLSAEQLQDAVGYVTGSLRSADQLAQSRAELENKVELEYARIVKDQAKWEVNMRAQVQSLPRWAGVWHAIGPFGDPRKGKMDAVAYPPEQSLDLTTTYADGKLAWKKQSDWPEGKVFSLPSTPGVYYLQRQIHAATEGATEITVEKRDLNKVWLNGQLVFNGSVDLRGGKNKVHTISLNLRHGPNDLLVRLVRPTGKAIFSFALAGQEKRKHASPCTGLTSGTPGTSGHSRGQVVGGAANIAGPTAGAYHDVRARNAVPADEATR